MFVSASGLVVDSVVGLVPCLPYGVLSCLFVWLAEVLDDIFALVHMSV